MECERELVARLRQGERAALAALWDAHAGPLYERVLLPRLGTAALAEDALAETFRTLVEDVARYEDQGLGLWPWLRRVAIGKAIDLHRKRARAQRALDRYAAAMAPLLGPAEAPQGALDEAEDAARIRAAVAATFERINPRYRRALELRFFEERPRADCAAALEVTVATFDVVLLRAVRAFRGAWEAQRHE